MMRVRCVRGFVGAAPSSGEELTALMRVFNKYKEEGTKGATHALRMLQKPVTSEKRELRAFSVLLSFQAQAGRWKTARKVWFLFLSSCSRKLTILLSEPHRVLKLQTNP